MTEGVPGAVPVQFHADDPRFREAFEAAVRAENLPLTRHGDGYRSSYTMHAFRLAYSTVNRLGLYAAPFSRSAAPVAYIRRDHLQMARLSGFLCRVEATKRAPDMDPIYLDPPAPDPAGDPLVPERVAEDAQDAARYRWLRDKSVPPHNFYISVPDEFQGVRYQPAEVDAYIDAALRAAGQPEPKP